MEQQSSKARTHLVRGKSEADLTEDLSVVMQAPWLVHGSVHTIAASQSEHQCARACPQAQGSLEPQRRLIALKPRALVTA